MNDVNLVLGDKVLAVQREPASEQEVFQIAWFFCLEVIKHYGAMDTLKMMMAIQADRFGFTDGEKKDEE